MGPAAAVIGAVASVVGTVSSINAQQRAAKAQRQAAAVQQRQQQLQTRRSQRAAIRQSQLQRAQALTTAGALGVARYSVFTKDSDSLKSTEVVSDRKISGDYQPLAGGLQIRWAGSADDSEAILNDEWEVEVSGWYEEVDNSSMNSVRMTRR